ncbi:MAG: glycine/betaine/sarcosine/D-proline family reductase selenoprotein B [Desulfobacteraceae bacterium]|nr:glycine/betaine/sarcosine/D-proline family reductase selenoprotein B [Desulfobacteraceae bacterium]
MARLDTMPEPMRSHLADLPCPTFDTRPWVSGPSLSRRRVAIISTAGLHRRDDRPFEGMTGDFRVIPHTCTAKDLVMTHVSTNFDRTGFQQDWNVVFPLDRLRELADDNTIGSVADFHYSFMGAADPAVMETAAQKLAGLLTGDQVDAALLVPV